MGWNNQHGQLNSIKVQTRLATAKQNTHLEGSKGMALVHNNVGERRSHPPSSLGLAKLRRHELRAGKKLQGKANATLLGN